MGDSVLSGNVAATLIKNATDIADAVGDLKKVAEENPEIFDLDKDGAITTNDLKVAFTEIKKEITTLREEIDTNKDGKVSAKEIKTFLATKSSEYARMVWWVAISIVIMAAKMWISYEVSNEEPTIMDFTGDLAIFLSGYIGSVIIDKIKSQKDAEIAKIQNLLNDSVAEGQTKAAKISQLTYEVEYWKKIGEDALQKLQNL